MSTSVPEMDPRATDLGFHEDTFWVDLADGRRLVVPLAWFPRLLKGAPSERANWELLGEGRGIHWPEIDEDVSVHSLLLGLPAPGGSKRAG